MIHASFIYFNLLIGIVLNSMDSSQNVSKLYFYVCIFRRFLYIYIWMYFRFFVCVTWHFSRYLTISALQQKGLMQIFTYLSQKIVSFRQNYICKVSFFVLYFFAKAVIYRWLINLNSLKCYGKEVSVTTLSFRCFHLIFYYQWWYLEKFL